MPACRQVNLGTAKVDLRLDLTDFWTNVEGYLEYSTALWDAGSIARLADSDRAVIEAVLANPDCEVGRLPLLTDAEGRPWVTSRLAGPTTNCRCIHELFEHRAASSPDAIAVTDGHEHVSF